MKAQELRDIAARLNRLADEMEGIKADGGTLRVKIPSPDLFTQMGISDEDTMKEVAGLSVIKEQTEPAKRHYNRVGVKMAEALTIRTAEKIGKAQGFCMRSDVERSLVRITGRSSEDVRKVVNQSADELRLTCFVSNSYRYYRRMDRAQLMNLSMEKLAQL